MSDVAIRLRDVSIELGAERRRVLNGVNLEVRRGEVLAVVGRSGVGKSTLLRVVAGLVDVAAGSIDYPQPVGSMRTSLVFQDHRLMPWLTVIDNVESSIRRTSKPASRARAIASSTDDVGRTATVSNHDSCTTLQPWSRKAAATRDA